MIINGGLWTNAGYVEWMCRSGYGHQAASNTLLWNNHLRYNDGIITVEGPEFWRSVRHQYQDENPRRKRR